MTFPAELTLRTFPEGIRMCRCPVKEIERLYGARHAWSNQPLLPGENLLSALKGDLFDISAEVELGSAAEVGFILRGETVRYTVSDRKLSCLGKSADLSPVSGRIKLRILLDRASIEIFGNDGRVPMSFCFLPEPEAPPLALSASTGPARLISLTVHALRSAWQAPVSV
jgi:sucrose-6-phosphate hydrolase SacC (GH32 family)